MAVQRPLKEGNVRTYQEKVALGFHDILANEMDADLDTIYAAWNGGPAGPASGRLTGTYPSPGLAADVEQTVVGNFASHNVSILHLPRAWLQSFVNGTGVEWLYNDVASSGYIAGNSGAGINLVQGDINFFNHTPGGAWVHRGGLQGATNKWNLPLIDGLVTKPMLAPGCGVRNVWVTPIPMGLNSGTNQWVAVATTSLTTAGGTVLVMTPATLHWFGPAGANGGAWLRWLVNGSQVTIWRWIPSVPGSGNANQLLPSLTFWWQPPAGTWSAVFEVSANPGAVTTPPDAAGNVEYIEYA